MKRYRLLPAPIALSLEPGSSMNATFQTVAALLIVAGAVGGLIWRSVAKRGKPGCGGGCGPTDQFKKHLKRSVGR